MRRALAPLCLLLASLTQASEIRWQCSLSPDLTRLHCLAAGPTSEAGPTAAADGSASREIASVQSPPKAEVRGTRFPLDTRRAWTVELWSPPDDGAFVEQLARATMCYRTPRCQVQVDLQPLSRRDAAVAAAR